MYNEEITRLRKINDSLIPLVEVDVEDFVKCSNDEKQAKKFIGIIKNAYECIQKKHFYYKKVNESFLDTFMLYTDSESYTGLLKINPYEFDRKIDKYLCVDKYCDWDRETAIRVLKNIDNKDRLKYTFPRLYEDYVTGCRSFFAAKEGKNPEINVGICYNEYGLRYVLKKYIDNQIILHKNIENNKENFFDEPLFKKSLSPVLFDYIDKDKYELLLANTYLNEIKQTTDESKKKILFNLLQKYIEQSDKKDIFITNKNGTVTTYDDFLTNYKNYLKDNEYGKILVLDMDILPRGIKNYELSEGTSFSLKKNVDYVKKNVEKIEFFNHSKFKRAIQIENDRKTYTVFIYPNGEILVDKFGTKGKPEAGYANAIYNLNIYNFYKFKDIDKMSLRQMGIKSLNHYGSWQDRANEIINKEANETIEKDTEVFVKCLEKGIIKCFT